MRLSWSVAIVALALAGCANEPGTPSRQATGSVFDAFTGGANLSSSGSPSGSRTTGNGSPTGSATTGSIAAGLDERDRQRAYAAEIHALETGEPGEPTGWRSDAPGRYGTVVPGVQYQARGTRCRDFTHTIYIDGRPQAARQTACRNSDGTWSPVG